MRDDGPPAVRALIDGPPGAPLPRQVAIVREALRSARASGLRMPQFSLVWRDGARGGCRGAVALERATGRYTMYLCVTLWPEQLRTTVWHEIQHLHDLAAGESFTRATLERRATQYAARMAGRWGFTDV